MKLKSKREIWQWPNLEGIWADIAFAFRQLGKSPGFAIPTILTLALGFAAALTVFGFVDSALIRPLPYPDLPRLMGVFKTTQLGNPYAGYSFPDYLDLERSNRVFSSIAAYEGDHFVLSDAQGAHLVDGSGVSNGFFRVLGVTPALGRDFVPQTTDEDLQAVPATVILSYAAWRKWFDGRPDALGKTVTLNGEAYSVIGVLPRSFEFAPAGAIGFWTTLRSFAGDSCQFSRGCMAMGVIARLKEGVTEQQALANLRAIAAREARLHPDPDRNRGANIAPLSQWILGDVQPILLALLGGAALLLLIAYVNVAGLLVVRSESRRREFALRGAFGAARGRLIQQFIVEGFVVVAPSVALGLVVAVFARRLLLEWIPASMLNGMPYLRSGWDWHVPALAVALALIALILFAMAPTLRLSSVNLHESLAEGGRATAGRGWRRLGAKLVVLELAAAMVLLSGAGLLGKSLYELLHVRMGFVPSHLATLTMLAPQGSYANAEQTLALQREIMSRLRRLPGVIAVGTARHAPVTDVPSTQIGFVGMPSLGESNEVGHQVISAGYLSLLKARLVEGRDFNLGDNAGAPSVAIVNQTLARRYFPGENPIGRHIYYHQHGSERGVDGPRHPIEIVGVIADVKEYALDERSRPVVYTPYAQGPSRSFRVVVRTSQEAGSVLPSLVAAIHGIDPEILTSDAATMPEIIRNSPAAYLHRASTWLAGGFAALALLLGAVGLYGVISYSAGRRTREIAIRMALGATNGSVYQLILKEAGWLVMAGLLIGVPGAIAAGMLMRSLLFGVHSWDVSVLGAVAVLLTASALLASYIPAHSAASVNPTEALRAE